MILLLLSLLGSVALCLYGMRVMSQGLLKLAGARIRARLRVLPRRRLRCFGLGCAVTALLQSSSAITVMVVSMVNAGLLELGQAVALIMGANVGTTLTAWLFALLGYALPVGGWAVALVCLALPLACLPYAKARPWAEAAMGLALMVLGFTAFVGLMPEPAAHPVAAAWVAEVAAWGVWSVVLFCVGGLALTVCLQGSAATLLLAMGLVASGWVTIPMAVAMVVGDNVGTTMTALWASRGASVMARRAALSHLGFNLAGMVWALPLALPLGRLALAVAGLVGPSGLDVGAAAVVACGVALCHTSFNLLTAMLLLPFVGQVVRLLCRLLPVRSDDEDEFHLFYIAGGLPSTAELSVEEARRETASFGERCRRMLRLTADFIRMPLADAGHVHAFTRIEKYEKITDRLEREITCFIGALDRASMTQHIRDRVRALTRECDELESIGDCCYSLARAVIRRRDHAIAFTARQQADIDRMVAEVDGLMALMVQMLAAPELTAIDMNRAYALEDGVNALRASLRDANIASVRAGRYSYQSGVIYMDIINGLERIGDCAINVLEAQRSQSL